MSEPLHDQEVEDAGVVRWSTETVRVDGVDLPARLWFLVPDLDRQLPGQAEVYVEIDPVNGPVARGLRIIPSTTSEASAVTYRDMDRALAARSLDDEVEHAVLLAVGERAARALGRGRTIFDPHDQGAEAAFASAFDRAAASARPRRRRSITPALLAEVASVYREALSRGVPPTQTVAEHFTVSHRTATRWVAEARASGHLGASIGPVAGEAPAPPG